MLIYRRHYAFFGGLVGSWHTSTIPDLAVAYIVVPVGHLPEKWIPGGLLRRFLSKLHEGAITVSVYGSITAVKSGSRPMPEKTRRRLAYLHRLKFYRV